LHQKQSFQQALAGQMTQHWLNLFGQCCINRISVLFW
jgi:hypothetical protein